MVSGKSQAIDSAFIKANASFDSIVEKEINLNSKKYFDNISENEEDFTDKKKSKTEKYNDNFVSLSDPDSRMSKKRGKSCLLNHLGIISVDTDSHVICGAAVDFTDKTDMQTTELIVSKTIDNLQENGLKLEEVLADSGYSSGETYKYLQKQNINSYIPVHGGYKPQKDGFIYDKNNDCYKCE